MRLAEVCIVSNSIHTFGGLPRWGRVGGRPNQGETREGVGGTFGGLPLLNTPTKHYWTSGGGGVGKLANPLARWLSRTPKT